MRIFVNTGGTDPQAGLSRFVLGDLVLLSSLALSRIHTHKQTNKKALSLQTQQSWREIANKHSTEKDPLEPVRSQTRVQVNFLPKTMGPYTPKETPKPCPRHGAKKGNM